MSDMRIAVIGAGVMGSGIAQTTATYGYRTHCYDLSEDQIRAARELVVNGRYGLDRAVERNKISPEWARAAQERLSFGTDLAEALDSADLVIEAIPEDLGLKTRMFRRLDEMAPPEAILTSNTSGHPICALAGATTRPEKVMGWHWSSPPPVMPLAELVVTPQTSQATVDAVVQVATACGKNPVVVKENPFVWGFVGNRLLTAMVREAQRVVDEGLASKEQVDQIVVDGYRWPVGPFAMMEGASSGWGEKRSPSTAPEGAPWKRG
ncbi:3-hydroxyacyl-CoA dehydrogenase family protein [Microtetraspora malaysiensis]|uniref:3-hydroxyacyl-CoA dehydrogenase family protein n=1 Tax=Microtetraspora malaysiensis TaxID=161358 RepID=UPI003D8BCD87